MPAEMQHSSTGTAVPDISATVESVATVVHEEVQHFSPATRNWETFSQMLFGYQPSYLEQMSIYHEDPREFITRHEEHSKCRRKKKNERKSRSKQKWRHHKTEEFNTE
ncbi:hypothetical protein TKK_0000949 [Trichogramma kaykai]